MAMEIEQPESLEGGGNFVDQPGVYHMLVTDVDENPAKQDGSPLDATRVSLSVLAGPINSNQKDRAFELMLWNPNSADDESKQNNAKKLQTKFCLATCLIGHHQPGQRVTVEPTDAKGRQLAIRLSWKQEFNEVTKKWTDTDRVKVHFTDIWHVDDNEALKAGVNLDHSALAMIPTTLRKPVTNANGNQGNGNGHVTTAPAAGGSTRAAPAVDLSSI